MLFLFKSRSWHAKGFQYNCVHVDLFSVRVRETPVSRSWGGDNLRRTVRILSTGRVLQQWSEPVTCELSRPTLEMFGHRNPLGTSHWSAIRYKTSKIMSESEWVVIKPEPECWCELVEVNDKKQNIECLKYSEILSLPAYWPTASWVPGQSIQNIQMLGG